MHLSKAFGTVLAVFTGLAFAEEFHYPPLRDATGHYSSAKAMYNTWDLQVPRDEVVDWVAKYTEYNSFSPQFQKDFINVLRLPLALIISGNNCDIPNTPMADVSIWDLVGACAGSLDADGIPPALDLAFNGGLWGQPLYMLLNHIELDHILAHMNTFYSNEDLQTVTLSGLFVVFICDITSWNLDDFPPDTLPPGVPVLGW